MKKTFKRIHELMKKLASLLKINGLVPTYGYAHTFNSFLYLNLNKKICS